MHRMKAGLALALLAATLATRPVHADKERAPAPRVFAAADGAVAFAMLPPAADGRDGGRGIAYALQRDGTFKVLYRTQGWYASEVFLSADGHSLVRLGDWHRGRTPSKDHLAVAFYRDGRLVRQYMVPDLLKDPAKVRATVSHYFWRPDEGGEGPKPELADADLSFTLQTMDGWEYVFDLKTGDIKRQSPVGTPR